MFRRTYARPKGSSKETWEETVERVGKGNLKLVYGEPSNWSDEVWDEYYDLRHYMNNMAIIPAGRHLWASGVTSMLFNCWYSHWYEKFSDHFGFTSNRLFEGGGVGANYSSKYLEKFGAPKREIRVDISCTPTHQDIGELRTAGLDSTKDNLGDFVGDTREGWADALTSLIDFAFSPRGAYSDNTIYFDVSNIRPSGSQLVSSGGTASGPAPLVTLLKRTADILNRAHKAGQVTPMDAMEIDHAIAEAVVAGGTRRSARMSIVRWDDPFIFDFIACKADSGLHWTTNISVEIDDEFLENLKLGDGGTSQRVYQAKAVHAAVCEAVLNNGEPGYWNSSLSNVGEVNEVYGTNPCGEITLEVSEPCNLGHVNLDYFHDKPREDLEEAHRLITRFLMRATFGDVKDPRSREILNKNRRIGVGHLGVQGYWAKRGVKYADIRLWAPELLSELYDVVRQEAREYAFQLRIPEPVKVTTVAPTGSVAKLPGVSEGIHPIYARWYERRIRFSMRNESEFETVAQAQADGFKVEDDIYDKSGMTKVVVYPTEDILVAQVRALGIDESVVQSAEELTAREMLEVQRCYQRYWADNAVSYTVNVSEGALEPWDLEILLREFLPYLKGTTIMVDASRPQAPYTRITREEYEAATAKRVEDSTDLECSNGSCPVK